MAIRFEPYSLVSDDDTPRFENDTFREAVPNIGSLGLHQPHFIDEGGFRFQRYKPQEGDQGESGVSIIRDLQTVYLVDLLKPRLTSGKRFECQIDKWETPEEHPGTEHPGTEPIPLIPPIPLAPYSGSD